MFSSLSSSARLLSATTWKMYTQHLIKLKICVMGWCLAYLSYMYQAPLDRPCNLLRLWGLSMIWYTLYFSKCFSEILWVDLCLTLSVHWERLQMCWKMIKRINATSVIRVDRLWRRKELILNIIADRSISFGIISSIFMSWNERMKLTILA